MLVLGRKENESIIIGNNIRVTIVGRSGSSIRLGVQAPRDVRIVREELTAEQGEISAGGDDGKQASGESSSRVTTESDQDESSPAPSGAEVMIAALSTLSMPPQTAG